MKTEFLEKLGLTKEAIDKIMAENGKDIAAEQAKTASANTAMEDYKTKYETADTSLAELRKKDIAGIEKELTEYKQKSEQLAEQIKAKDYASSVESFLGGYKFTSELAKKAVLNEIVEKQFQVDGSKLLGAEDYMKTVMEKNPAAFVVEEKKPFTGSTSTGGGEAATAKDEANAAFRAAFGKE